MTTTPLLLLPGTLNDAALWQTQIDALGNSANVRVANVTAQRSIGAMAEDAIALMPDGPFAMAGFSLGGFVAFEVLRRAAGRVSGLALVNTQARAETAEGKPGREKMMALAGRDFPRLTATLIQFMLPPERHADAALVQDIQSMMDRTGAEAFVRQSQAVMDRADSRDLLARITCPTLIIGGLEDKVAPPRFSEEMASSIAGAQLHLLPGTGHLAPLERPGEVTALMLAWLDQVRGNTTP